jgi:hypothetical protein
MKYNNLNDFDELFISEIYNISDENQKIMSRKLFRNIPIFNENEDHTLYLENTGYKEQCKLDSQVALGLADYYLSLSNTLSKIEDENNFIPENIYSPTNIILLGSDAYIKHICFNYEEDDEGEQNDR